MNAKSGSLELIVAQRFAGDLDKRSRREGPVDLVAKHYRASGKTGEQYVQACSDSRPEMNLKHCPAQPDALRLPHELLPDRHRARS